MAPEEQILVAERKVIEQAGMFQGLDLGVYFSQAKVGRLTVRNSNTKCSKQCVWAYFGGFGAVRGRYYYIFYIFFF